MTHFECRAVEPDGTMVRFVLQAEDRNAAAIEIRVRGLSPVSIEETDAESVAGGFSPGRFLPVTTKDKVLFFRMLATLVRSDVTVTEALRVLYRQSDRANMTHVLSHVLSRVEGGSTLSDALAHHPRVFTPMVVNLVRAGEMGGILDTVFQRIADYLEGRSALRKKLLMSFFYPGIVLVVGVGVVVFMVMFVIPRFMGLITGALPPVTQFLMDTTTFLQHNGGSILVGVGVAVGTVVLLQAIPVTRFLIDRYKMRLPVLGPVIRLGTVVSFARTFSILLESRIPMVEALRATGATITNTAVQYFLDQVVDRVLGGEPLSAALEDGWAFTPLTTSLASIGEYSGLMSETMVTVAEVHEKLLEDKIARMSAMVEPVLILTLGGLVGLVVYGLISGMLAMYGGAV